jgi:glyceraldehyde-3-phosphate dehydrogenase (NADP+)
VLINETSDVRIDSMPFGGFKKSGGGPGRRPACVREMTEPKNTIINLAGVWSHWEQPDGLAERTTA